MPEVFLKMVIDGKSIANGIIERLKKLPKPEKFFGAALVGDDPASINFLKQKGKMAGELGIEFRLYGLPITITTDELRHEISRLAGPKTCGGFIVQLPLPDKINRHYALNAIPKEKDVDFLSEAVLGGFYTGRSPVVPPSVGVVEEILRIMNYELGIMKIIIVGSGFLVGKPITTWLQNKAAEITIFNEYTRDLKNKLKNADIVISGAGHLGLFGAKHLKEGAVVIDFGFNRNAEGKIVGDFDSAGADDKNIRYTKTPSGTGPILVAKLFENFYTLATKK